MQDFFLAARQKAAYLATMLRNRPVQVRCRDAEKRAFKQAADLAGLSLSGWIMLHLRKAAAKELKELGRPVPFLDDLDNS